jgi:hypothetical protein
VANGAKKAQPDQRSRETNKQLGTKPMVMFFSIALLYSKWAGFQITKCSGSMSTTESRSIGRWFGTPEQRKTSIDAHE